MSGLSSLRVEVNSMDLDSDKFRIFSFYNDEIESFLVNNSINLQRLLEEQENIRVCSEVCSDPAHPDTKDAATVILASAATLSMLMPSIVRILEILLHRPVKVTEQVPIQLKDERGNPILTNNGQPRVVWVDRTKIVQAQPQSVETNVVVGFLGLKFEYASKPVK